MNSKTRARVVVEAADERRVELVGDPGIVEQGADRGEVLGVVIVQAVEQDRRVAHHLASAAGRSASKARSGLRSIRLADLLGQLVLVRAQVAP